jgi:hypothetical protein
MVVGLGDEKFLGIINDYLVTYATTLMLTFEKVFLYG